MKIAIVTGASSGLGMAFVRRLDALGGLDEIWGVARRGERLEALAAELRTPMRPLALDLTRLESVETLRVLMREEAPEVAVLVNAAGSVSYTHLDVYKRQGRSSARPGPGRQR